MATAFKPDEDRSQRFRFNPPSIFPDPSHPCPGPDPDGFQTRKARPKPRVEEEVKPTHVFYDWDNAPLPKGYDVDSLYDQMTKALKEYDPKLEISSFTACGEFYSLSQNEDPNNRKKISKERIQSLKNICESEVFTVPSRVRICKGCNKQFPDLASFRDHNNQVHSSNNYQDEWSRVMDVGDAILAREMKMIQSNLEAAGELGVFLLISSDSDFVSSAQYLADRGWNLLLAVEDKRPSPVWDYARAIWTYENLYLGRKPFGYNARR